MQGRVLGPINYLNKRCYIISKENYEHFLKSSDEPVVGQLSSEEEYYETDKETYNRLQNEQQRSTSNAGHHFLSPINYQDNEIYAIGEVLALEKIPKNKIMGRMYLYEEYYAINEEAYKNYLSKNDQLRRFMQRLVRPINHDDTECYVINNKENYKYIQEIIHNRRQIKLVIDDVYYVIGKPEYDKYLHMQNDQIRKLLRQLVRQKVYKGEESYLISEENYDHFLAKIQNPQLKVKGKEVCHEKYYEIDKKTYNHLQNIQNDQQNSERQDESLSTQRQVLGQLNYSNKECYVINKEDYECFFKPSNQQFEGQVKINEVYYVVSKETYDENLKNNSGNLQQVLGPIRCLDGETYIIGEAYEEFLTDQQIVRRITINKEYYIIDKEAYDHLRFKQFIQRLLRPINHNNTEYYVTRKENYKYILGIIPNKQAVKKMNIEEDYYTIRKDMYRSNFQYNQQIQVFMQQFIRDSHDYFDDEEEHCLIFKKNYDHFFKNIINEGSIKLVSGKGEYYGIIKVAYDKCVLRNDQQTPEQQDELELILQKFMQQNFTQRQVLGQLNYLGNECYVVGKENYIDFLERIQKTPDQEKLLNDNVVGPINHNNTEYYMTRKENYKYILGIIPNKQAVKKMNIEEDYYMIRKDMYRSYFQYNQQIQVFMQQFIRDSHDYFDDEERCLISKKNYDHFFKNIINEGSIKLKESIME